MVRVRLWVMVRVRSRVQVRVSLGDTGGGEDVSSCF